IDAAARGTGLHEQLDLLGLDPTLRQRFSESGRLGERAQIEALPLQSGPPAGSPQVAVVQWHHRASFGTEAPRPRPGVGVVVGLGGEAVGVALRTIRDRAAGRGLRLPKRGGSKWRVR